MEFFFWFNDLMIPIMMIAIGYWFKNNPPKNVNWIYGYRTKRSMSSKEAWIFAQHCLGDFWFKIGLGLLVVIIFDKLLIQMASEELSSINIVINLIGVIVPIYFVEKRLKQAGY